MPEKKIGCFAFVLHSHLPYVLDHGRWPHGMDWLNEAMAETYIPLIDLLYRLLEEGYSPRITIGITPVLAEQLSDGSFPTEFASYLENKIQSAKADYEQFSGWSSPHMAQLANFWKGHYSQIKARFEKRYNRDLIVPLRDLQEKGAVELITSAATHGYLPLLGEDTSIQAQIKEGILSYERIFGGRPRGIWLPECAYRPRYEWTPPVGDHKGKWLRKGIEEFLSENGIEYFIIDSVLLKGGKSIGVYIDRFEALKRLWGRFEKQYKPQKEDEEKNPYEVYLVGSSEGKKPVAVFTRDPQTGLQVWSGEWGYPGDGWYLDFHKKHFPGGHRYWRVTSAKSDLADKLEYEPERAEERVTENARHFHKMVKGILTNYRRRSGKGGIICAPFDSELFGHWWFEGPQWLYQVLKLMGQDPQIELTTCGEYLDRAQPFKVVSLPEGSWGKGGYHYIWLNEWTQWTWKHIYEDERKMKELAQRFGDTKDNNLLKILKQVARELMLLESSDWQFLISTWSARDYAELRLSEHHLNFCRLADMAERYGKGKWVDPGEWKFLGACEERDRIFPDIKIEWFKEVEYPPK